MKRHAARLSRRTRAVTVLLVLSFVILLHPRSLAQEKVKLPDASGTHIFRRILHEVGCKPLYSLEQLKTENPSTSVLIALGDLSAIDRLHNRFLGRILWPFISSGGSALLATDARHSKWGVYELGQQAKIHRGPVQLPEDSIEKYNGGNGVFIKGLADAPIFGDLTRVAAIQPGYLELIRHGQLQNLAELPSDAQVANRVPVYRCFAAGFDKYGNNKNGRLLVMADHAILMNAMLWQRTGPARNDNFEAAVKCVSWLTENAKRKNVLFIEDGRIEDEFDTSFLDLPPPPLPRIEDVVHAVNQGLQGIQEENLFNDWLAGLAKDVAPRVAIVTLTVLLTAYGLLRLGQAKHHVEPGIPVLRSGLAQLVPSVQLTVQRKRWLLREGNFAEVAQALARQFVESLGQTHASNPHSQEQPPPRIASNQGWWDRWQSRRAVRHLWELAYGERPRRVSARQLRKLRTSIDDLRAALERGRLQIGVEPVSGRLPARPATPQNV